MYPNAQISLGLVYANGQSVPQSHHEAGKWFRKAVEQDADGMVYGTGRGVPRFDLEAIKWAKKQLIKVMRKPSKPLNI
jgi:hypothetical protein